MKNLFLFFSAFIPMYVLLLLKLIMELINKNITFNVLNSILFCLLIVLIVLGVFGIVWNVILAKDKSEEIIIIKKVNITDQHFFGYFSIFILFALSFDITKVSMFVVSVLIMVLIGIVYITNAMFYINPFLNILGFKFYEITYKLKNDDVSHVTKMFFRGDIILNEKIYKVKLKNENFSFIDIKK